MLKKCKVITISERMVYIYSLHSYTFFYNYAREKNKRKKKERARERYALYIYARMYSGQKKCKSVRIDIKASGAII